VTGAEGPDRAGSVIRAPSLVPDEARELGTAHYLPCPSSA
jgi:hypothetical protein